MTVCNHSKPFFNLLFLLEILSRLCKYKSIIFFSMEFIKTSKCWPSNTLATKLSSSFDFLGDRIIDYLLSPFLRFFLALN